MNKAICVDVDGCSSPSPVFPEGARGGNFFTEKENPTPNAFPNEKKGKIRQNFLLAVIVGLERRKLGAMREKRGNQRLQKKLKS